MDISVLASEYLWSHGAISDDTLMLKKTVCNDSKYLREYFHGQLSKECKDVVSRALDEISSDVDSSDLLMPKCLLSDSAQQFRMEGLQGKIYAEVVYCL